MPLSHGLEIWLDTQNGHSRYVLINLLLLYPERFICWCLFVSCSVPTSSCLLLSWWGLNGEIVWKLENFWEWSFSSMNLLPMKSLLCLSITGRSVQDHSCLWVFLPLRIHATETVNINWIIMILGQVRGHCHLCPLRLLQPEFRRGANWRFEHHGSLSEEGHC